MVDQAPQAPGSGGSFSFDSIPTWAWIVGGGVLIGGFLWWRSRNNAGASSTLPDQSVAPVVDPTTGGLIDPSTGQTYVGSGGSAAEPSNDQWRLAAQDAAQKLGYAPALVDNALYDFLNGNPLNAQEGGVINTLLGKVGYPTLPVPFIGTPPGTPKPPPKKPTTAPKRGYAWVLINNVWRQVRYASQGPIPPLKPKPKTVTHQTAAQSRTTIANMKPILSTGGLATTQHVLAGPVVGVNAPRPVVAPVAQRPSVITAPPIHGSPTLTPNNRAALSYIQSVLAGHSPLPQGVAVPKGYALGPNRILHRV